jgi:hypothetical protein
MKKEFFWWGVKLLAETYDDDERLLGLYDSSNNSILISTIYSNNISIRSIVRGGGLLGSDLGCGDSQRCV